ncbi:MAG: hypothetical protein IKZ88_05050 [Neisseriaceae bacterium]|nr:hypothetical protein [Neisseriaceae bacterium]
MLNYFFRLPERFFALPLYLVGYPETVFKLAYRSFKNCFRRLPRRACGTARNDEQRLPERFSVVLVGKNAHPTAFCLPQPRGQQVAHPTCYITISS